MSKTWFTADLHLFHKNILRFCPKTRPEKNSNDMSAFLAISWNKQVQPDDEVYILGDICLGDLDLTRGLLDRMNGKFHLIKGNHDTSKMLAILAYRFKTIQDYKKLYIGRQKFILFHYPILEWDTMHHGAIHLFGHVHGKPMNIEGKCMDVGMDTRPGYKLYSVEEIMRKMENKEIKSHHDRKREQERRSFSS